MSDRIAISGLQAARVMFTNGMEDINAINLALRTIKQPTAGYYYPSDVYNYIKEACNG